MEYYSWFSTCAVKLRKHFEKRMILVTDVEILWWMNKRDWSLQWKFGHFIFDMPGEYSNCILEDTTNFTSTEWKSFVLSWLFCLYCLHSSHGCVINKREGSVLLFSNLLLLLRFVPPEIINFIVHCFNANREKNILLPTVNSFHSTDDSNKTFSI